MTPPAADLASLRGALTLPQRHQVHVWTAEIDRIPDHRVAMLAALLSMEEQARLDRFLVRDARLQYLASHASLRLLLSAYTGHLPESWEFRRDEQDKPFIANPEACRGLHFNLSHTSGRIMFALRAGAEIGIDVERFGPGLDVAGISRIVLAPAELKALQAVPDAGRRGEFLRYWVLKEAILKALGLGFSLDPRAVTLELHAAARLASLGGPGGSPNRWRLYEGGFATGHLWAVAVPDPAPDAERPTPRCFRI